MLELFRQLSDDQLAVLGCVGALATSLLLLSLSFHSQSGNRGEDARKQDLQHGAADQQQRKAA